MMPWKKIADEAPPKGKQVLLYEPRVPGRHDPAGGLAARVVVDTWPTSYPRKATRWAAIPEITPDMEAETESL